MLRASVALRPIRSLLLSAGTSSHGVVSMWVRTQCAPPEVGNTVFAPQWLPLALSRLGHKVWAGQCVENSVFETFGLRHAAPCCIVVHCAWQVCGRCCGWDTVGEACGQDNIGGL